jgi:hypothetical protein
MRRLPALFAVLALAVPGLAHAQTAPATAPAADPTAGVSVAEVRAWLTSLGGSVGEPVTSNAVTTLQVADTPLPWFMSFYNCGPSRCDDVQYSAAFAGPLTVDQVNAWNRDNRFLKAFFTPAATAGEGTAVVQYDLILLGTGAEQLQEPTVLWLQLLETFATRLSAGAAPAAAPPPA